jgi:hypothetical protein
MRSGGIKKRMCPDEISAVLRTQFVKISTIRENGGRGTEKKINNCWNYVQLQRFLAESARGKEAECRNKIIYKN